MSRIASGVPIGGDLEYIDEITLYRALEGRTRHVSSPAAIKSANFTTVARWVVCKVAILLMPLSFTIP